jgi:hypothetical protein
LLFAAASLADPFDRLGNPQPLESAGNFEIFEHTQIMSDQLLHMLQHNDF